LQRKKGEQEAIELVQSPPMYNTLYRFDIALDKFLSADFGVIDTVLVHGHPQPIKSPDVDESEVLNQWLLIVGAACHLTTTIHLGEYYFIASSSLFSCD
jgi:hypothetical protein